MIRTIDGKRLQLRFDWTGVAIFFGTDRRWTAQVFWWKRPRIVVRHDHDTFSFPRYF